MDRTSVRALDALEKASTVEALCIALERCRTYLNNGMGSGAGFENALKEVFKNKSEECRRRSKAYAPAGVYASNVHLYSDLSACLIFAGFRICRCRDGEELSEQLEFLADFFGNHMTRPLGGILTRSEAGALLALVQEKYGMLSAVTCDRELEIYLINRSHIHFDSFLITYKSVPTGKSVSASAGLYKWLLFSLSPRFDLPECNKYHVFLHEMGHVLYNAVTSGTDTLPGLFEEIAFILGLDLKEDIKHAEELFADLFSAATLNGSGFSAYNPFGKIIRRDIYALLELYFRMLADRAGRDRYGNASLTGLLH